MTSPATTFAGSVNPFTGLGTLPSILAAARAAESTSNTTQDSMTQPKPAKPPKPAVTREYIDPDALVVCDDPMPSGRAAPDKYAAVFDQLKLGQCVKCKPDQVSLISGAMRKWAKQRSKPCIVRATARYPSDGQGRVWLLADPKAKARK